MDRARVEEVNLIKMISRHLHGYKDLLEELKVQLYRRIEIVEKLKSLRADLDRYIRCGEIIYDITTNYIMSQSVEYNNGDMIDSIKIYIPKAEEEIIATEKFLAEILEDDSIQEEYIEDIRRQLKDYKIKNIFIELNTIQELLLGISEEGKTFYLGLDNFIEKLRSFNDLEEIVKYNLLNDFCYQNIEGNTFVAELLNLQNDYKGADVVAHITEVEGMWLVSKEIIERLKPLVDLNSGCYFEIVTTINELHKLRIDLLNATYVERQIELVDNLYMRLKEFIN